MYYILSTSLYLKREDLKVKEMEEFKERERVREREVRGVGRDASQKEFETTDLTLFCSADLVQGSTAKVEILEHMVRIPVETKSHPFGEGSIRWP